MQTTTQQQLPTGRFVVGLTGGIGCGKSSVALRFEAHGASIIDTDIIAHQLTAPGGAAMPALVACFGADMITADGAMDRARMRERVFNDVQQKKLLESILHPLIRAQLAHEAESATGPYLICVIPLLVESGHWQLSRILVVDCDEESQIQRVMQRNGLTEPQVRAIMANQASRSERCTAADDIIRNQGKLDDLEPEIARLHQLYCKLAYTHS